jgi:cell wall-associated NlpC family hydrolase
MKRMIIAGVVLTPLLLSGAALGAEKAQAPSMIATSRLDVGILKEPSSLTILEAQARLGELRSEAAALADKRQADVELAYQKQLVQTQIKLETVLAQLLSRVGKTPYVFSGSTPYGWDCSGLVVWAYGQLGLELPHSASKQGTVGVDVTSPIPGDVVLFANRSGIFHSAIYLGDDKIIHAGFRAGKRTEVLGLDSPSFANTTITFRRIVDTSN